MSERIEKVIDRNELSSFLAMLEGRTDDIMKVDIRLRAGSQKYKCIVTLVPPKEVEE